VTGEVCPESHKTETSLLLYRLRPLRLVMVECFILLEFPETTGDCKPAADSPPLVVCEDKLKVTLPLFRFQWSPFNFETRSTQLLDARSVLAGNLFEVAVCRAVSRGIQQKFQHPAPLSGFTDGNSRDPHKDVTGCHLEGSCCWRTADKLGHLSRCQNWVSGSHAAALLFFRLGSGQT
jgi:hypothetical protein